MRAGVDAIGGIFKQRSGHQTPAIFRELALPIVQQTTRLAKEHNILTHVHSCGPEKALIEILAGPQGVWTMQDQGKLTDLLTVHPYSIFTPYCDSDPVDTIRPILHATAQTYYYAGIGNKPCLAEELGTLGPMVSSKAAAADYVRANLFPCGRTTAEASCGWRRRF